MTPLSPVCCCASSYRISLLFPFFLHPFVSPIAHYTRSLTHTTLSPSPSLTPPLTPPSLAHHTTHPGEAAPRAVRGTGHDRAGVSGRGNEGTYTVATGQAAEGELRPNSIPPFLPPHTLPSSLTPSLPSSSHPPSHTPLPWHHSLRSSRKQCSDGWRQRGTG